MPTNWLGARLVDVPESLAGVTGIDSNSEAGRGGLTQRAVENIWASLENLYRSGAYPAITFCLRRQGEVVLNRSLGHIRGNGPEDAKATPKHLAQPDTPVCIFSASKAITAILLHKLAEEGGVDLDQRVSYYLAEFAANGKRDTTLSQVLAHRGGYR
jgi:CubicO group peptidase (beta-lactamase class C family)